MNIATYYCNDPAAPKPNAPTRIGTNVLLQFGGKLLLERRTDCGKWGLLGGRLRNGERYAAEPQRLDLERSAVRILKLLLDITH